MYKKQPWIDLTSQPRRTPQEIFKSQYEQNWASQFERAENVYLLVPTCFIEEAKTIVDRVSEPLEFYDDVVHLSDDLCFLVRGIKPSAQNISIPLCDAYIPHAVGHISKHRASDPQQTVINLDWYYWNLQDGSAESWFREYALCDNEIANAMYQAPNIDWQTQIAFCQKAKTLRLLKGNCNGLPKTSVQSPYWTSCKR